jgi:hypothetical protein
MTAKILVEIQPDGEKCGECELLIDPDMGPVYCGAFGFLGEVYQKENATRIPACLAAQSAAPSAELQEAWRGLLEAAKDADELLTQHGYDSDLPEAIVRVESAEREGEK